MADICPRCGALLAAYRNPLDAPAELSLPVAPVGTIRTPKQPSTMDIVSDASPSEESPAVPDVSEPVEQPAPADTRDLLDPAAAAPEWEPIEASIALPQPVPAEPVPLRHARPPSVPSVVVPAGETSGRGRRNRATVSHAPPGPAQRKPGYMVKGSVSVALIWGVALVLLSCVAFALAAASLGGRISAIAGGLGLFFGLAGSILIVFAMLVTLVRRESDR
jgi:hypothetical protein